MLRTRRETLKAKDSNPLVNAANAGANYYMHDAEGMLILNFRSIPDSDTGIKNREYYFEKAIQQLKRDFGLPEGNIDRKNLIIRLDGEAKEEISSQLKARIDADPVAVSFEEEQSPTTKTPIEKITALRTPRVQPKKHLHSSETSSSKEVLPGVTLSALLSALPAREAESVELQQQELLSLQKKLQQLSPAQFQVKEGEPDFAQSLKIRLAETPAENQPRLLAEMKDELVNHASMKGTVHIAKLALRNGVNLSVSRADDTHSDWDKRTRIIASILTDYLQDSAETLNCSKGKIYLNTKTPTELSECLLALASTQPQREKQ